MSATVKCRVFGGSQAKGVYLLMWVIMFVVFGSIGLGLPMPVSVLLMLVAVYAAIRRLAGTATYTLDGETITRHYISLSGHHEQHGVRGLRELSAWKTDHTMTRGFERYEYLELDTLAGPRWIITSRQDAGGFASFKDAFLKGIDALHSPAPSAQPEFAARPASSPLPRQRPSFYRTWLGRGVSLLFAVATGGLLAAAFGGLVALTGLIKLGLFIVPGTIYLLWRSFGPKR